jgi:Spy/CpxP family protein refolding chaperone
MWPLRPAFWFVALVLLNEGAAAATPSPYAGWQGGRSRGLSAEQIENLLSGRGMGMALPAELNGYPGPRHVLELARDLRLSPDQLARTRDLFEDMEAKAIALGEQIVAQEASLDQLFASGAAGEAAVQEVTAALGRLTGELRAHHLGYHLAMRDLLDPHQLEMYQRLRGYAGSAAPGGHRHDPSGHGGQ